MCGGGLSRGGALPQLPAPLSPWLMLLLSQSVRELLQPKASCADALDTFRGTWAVAPLRRSTVAFAASSGAPLLPGPARLACASPTHSCRCVAAGRRDGGNDGGSRPVRRKGGGRGGCGSGHVGGRLIGGGVV